MSGETFGHTTQDVGKAMQKESKKHSGGDIPAGSQAAGVQACVAQVDRELTRSYLQSIVDKATKDKDEVIAERQAKLPLPEQPPRPSDFNSSNEETVNVGSGGRQADVTRPGKTELREPATGDPASQSLK